jgi:hypothetical protein
MKRNDFDNFANDEASVKSLLMLFIATGATAGDLSSELSNYNNPGLLQFHLFQQQQELKITST